MSGVGMMDPAFFVGKNALLQWLNDFFEVNYQKVEQGASGAIHCQILDAIFPGKVPLHKVNFDAKTEVDFIKNFKVLQDVFNKEQIARHVPVEKLVKAKYQDNLEFLQWMKHFFDTRYGGQEYNAKERRDAAIQKYCKAKGVRPPPSVPSERKKPEPEPVADVPAPRRAPMKQAAAPAPAAAVQRKPPAAAAGGQRAAPAAPVSNGNAEEVSRLQEEIEALRQTVEGLEKERNFYFGKLREIEILCQTDEEMDSGTKQQVLQILYATDENDEFQAPEAEQGTGDIE